MGFILVKSTNLQCTDYNSNIKRLHHRFFFHSENQLFLKEYFEGKFYCGLAFYKAWTL